MRLNAGWHLSAAKPRSFDFFKIIGALPSSLLRSCPRRVRGVTGRSRQAREVRRRRAARVATSSLHKVGNLAAKAAPAVPVIPAERRRLARRVPGAPAWLALL